VNDAEFIVQILFILVILIGIFFFINIFRSKDRMDIKKIRDENLDEDDETLTTFENKSDGLLYINIPNIYNKLSQKNKFEKAYLLLSINNFRINLIEDADLEIIKDSTEVISNPYEFSYSFREKYGQFIFSVKKIVEQILIEQNDMNQISAEYANSLIDTVDIILATISYPLYSNEEYPTNPSKNQKLIKKIWDELLDSKRELYNAFLKVSEYTNQTDSPLGFKISYNLDKNDFDEVHKICQFQPGFLYNKEIQDDIYFKNNNYNNNNEDSFFYKLGSKVKPLINKKAVRNSEIEKDLNDLKKLLDNKTITNEEYEDARKSVLKKYYS